MRKTALPVQRQWQQSVMNSRSRTAALRAINCSLRRAVAEPAALACQVNWLAQTDIAAVAETFYSRSLSDVSCLHSSIAAIRLHLSLQKAS